MRCSFVSTHSYSNSSTSDTENGNLVSVTDANLNPEESSTLTNHKADILQYYERIRFDISYRQYLELFDIYRIYGIEIRMNEPWTDESDYSFLDITSAQFGLAIDTLYASLKLINNFNKSIPYIDDYINAISFCIIKDQNSKRQAWVSSWHSEGCYYIDYMSTISKQELAARLLSIIAYTEVDDITLKESKFSDYNANGFTNYDDEVLANEPQYIEYLAEYEIIDSGSVLIECQKAGLLTAESTKSIRDDFSEYIYQCISPSSQLIMAYSLIKPIQSKATAAFKCLETINPHWSRYALEENFSSLKHVDLFKGNLELGYSYFIAGGEYYGHYQNTSGGMTAALKIESVDDKTCEIIAVFTFYPAIENDVNQEKSGSYSMHGYVNFVTNEFRLVGDKWLTQQPEGYNMLDIVGVLFATKLVGDFERNSMTTIVMDRF